MKTIFNFLLVALLSCSACLMNTKSDKNINELDYTFSAPTLIVDLPNELDEVSGLENKSDEILHMINDEKGIIYEYSIAKKSIVNEVKFKKKSDFEGVAEHRGTFYILESSGKLYEVKKEEEKKTQLFKEGYEFEGLCYYAKNNSLLLACKKHKKSKKNDFIWIFEYDLEEKELKEDPFLKLEKKGIGKSFKPSGIAVHPDGDIYIISGVSSQIISVEPKSLKVKKAQLDKNQYPQIEGICFGKDKSLYIASEKNLLQNAKVFKFMMRE